MSLPYGCSGRFIFTDTSRSIDVEIQHTDDHLEQHWASVNLDSRLIYFSCTKCYGYQSHMSNRRVCGWLGGYVIFPRPCFFATPSPRPSTERHSSQI